MLPVPAGTSLPTITFSFNPFKIAALVCTQRFIGDVINFTVPVMQPGEEVLPNPYTSGRYVIMAIKHTIAVTTQNHTMVLRCMKDSVRTPYPKEEDALIVGKDNRKEINIYEEDIKAL